MTLHEIHRKTENTKCATDNNRSNPFVKFGRDLYKIYYLLIIYGIYMIDFQVTTKSIFNKKPLPILYFGQIDDKYYKKRRSERTSDLLGVLIFIR